MHSSARQSHRHTHRAPLFALLGLVATGILLLAWPVRREPVAVVICFSTAAMMVLFAQMVRYFTIKDEGDHLSLRYGPLPVFRKTIHYADISRVEAGRTLVTDVWGIH